VNLKITLIFGNKSEDDILLLQELEEFAKEFPNQFELVLIIDKALNPETWKYPTGYITKDLLKEYMPAPSDETLILSCGPPPMCNIVEKYLFEELEFDKEKHYFKF